MLVSAIENNTLVGQNCCLHSGQSLANKGDKREHTTLTLGFVEKSMNGLVRFINQDYR